MKRFTLALSMHGAGRVVSTRALPTSPRMTQVAGNEDAGGGESSELQAEVRALLLSPQLPTGNEPGKEAGGCERI